MSVVVHVRDVYGRAHWLNPAYVVSVSAPAPGGDQHHVAVWCRYDPIVVDAHEAARLIDTLKEKT